MSLLFNVLQCVDDVLWTYIGLPMLVLTGLYFTIKSGGMQFSVLRHTSRHMKDVIESANREHKHEGIHPIKLYFASIGGMIGLGNLVTVVATVTIGGPGSILWMWVASLTGAMVKYSEIYLGIKHRVYKNGEYSGGPMYYLQKAFPAKPWKKLLPIFSCILLCIYGVEISQFSILSDAIKDVLDINRYVAVLSLLTLVMISSIGGVRSLSNICVTLMPPFMISYIIVGIIIIVDHAAQIPNLLYTIASSAFTGHAALGGFIGSTAMLSARMGVSRAVYSGDICVGYDAIVQSETKVQQPEKQAALAVFSLLSDTLICTVTVVIVLLTGYWTNDILKPSEYVATAMAEYMGSTTAKIYFSILMFISGFTTIVGYLVMGQKCAKFLSPRFGRTIYMVYAIVAFICFSFHDQSNVMIIMTVSGGIIMITNILGVIKLRKSVVFVK